MHLLKLSCIGEVTIFYLLSNVLSILQIRSRCALSETFRLLERQFFGQVSVPKKPSTGGEKCLLDCLNLSIFSSLSIAICAKQ